MHSIYAVSCKHSFNGYATFDTNSSHFSSSCAFCHSCPLSTRTLHLNRLTQSSLLQFSPSRRFVFRAQVPYTLVRTSYHLNCPTNTTRRSRIKEQCFCLRDDSEIILSLLSEETDKDASANVSSSKRMEIKTNKKGNLKQHKASSIDRTRECEKPDTEWEALTKGENSRKQRDMSSCSSYYTLSSRDSETDLEVQHNMGLEEFSLGYDKSDANHMEGQVKEEFNRQKDDSEKVHSVSHKERVVFGADIDWNIRKRSEKKLTEGFVPAIESTREHLDMRPRESTIHESGYKKASISQKKVHREEDNASFVKHLDKKTNKAYIQIGNRRNHQSGYTQESGFDENESTLLSGKKFSGSEGNLEMSNTLCEETSDRHEKFVGSTSTSGKESFKSKKAFASKEGKLEISETHLQETSDKNKNFIGSSSTKTMEVVDKSSQKYLENLNIENTERTSNARMENVGEKKNSVLSYSQGVGLQHKREKTITHDDARRRKSQQFSEVSQAHGSYVEDISVMKSKASVKNKEESSYISSQARDSWLQTDRRKTQSVQHRKGYEHVSTLSEGRANEEKHISSSQITSEKMRFISKSKLAEAVKTRENSSQTDETASREKSSFQGSLNSVSEAGKQVMLAEGNERGSEVTLIPSSQMGRVSAHVEHTAGFASPDIYLETSESSSSALYNNLGISHNMLSGPPYSGPSIIMTPEDVLGSANRFEESSKQFVDEFVDKVRHEVTTSEIQEMEVARTESSFDVVDNQRQQGTQNSSHSTGLLGAKGISDEMWDVKEPSVGHGLLAEKPEIKNETAKPIVNRTGRSLWRVISDIVLLRWNSHAGSSSSAGRSGERNSPNKSDSETWFSGQEHEETGKSNVMKETSVLPQAITSDKSKASARYTQSEGEVSETKMLKDKGKLIEVESSFPNKLESGSTSIGTSYADGEEFSSRTENEKDLKVSTSSFKKMESPTPLSVKGKPIAGEIINIGGSNISRTESGVPIKEPVAPTKTEMSGSGKKDGELKQRKFQRKGQVLRDRFDDWEEAYKVELEQQRIDELFMKEALLEARKAADTWEVPVGAVLVQHGKIIARGCNLVEELRDSTAHAEMICIREASKFLHSWRLSETTLYVTLEPCAMCAGAILQARVDTVVWGAPNKLLGADGSWIRLFPDGGENVSEGSDIPPAPVHPFHPKIKIRRGVLATECADVMQQFFQLRRKNKKEEVPKEPSCLPGTHHHPAKLLNKIHDIFHLMFCL